MINYLKVEDRPLSLIGRSKQQLSAWKGKGHAVSVSYDINMELPREQRKQNKDKLEKKYQNDKKGHCLSLIKHLIKLLF